MPVFEWTTIAFITRPARQPPFHHNILAPERSVAIAAGWPEDRDNRGSHRRCKMHGAGITADEQFCRFTQRNKFFDCRRDLMHPAARGAQESPPQIFFARTPSHHDRMSIVHEPECQLTVPLRCPTFREPVAARINHDVIGEAGQFLSYRSSSRVSCLKTSFSFPIWIDPQRLQQ